MNETLGNGMLFKKKGIITALIDEFTAKVKVNDSKISIKIDQVSLDDDNINPYLLIISLFLTYMIHSRNRMSYKLPFRKKGRRQL